MILFRSVFIELITPFFVTLGATSFILMMGKIYKLISLMVESQLDFAEASTMFLFILPQSVTFMLPVGVLGAVFAVILRQSAESEVIAVRAAGRSVLIHSQPIILFGLLMTGVTSLMALWIQPAGNRNFLDFQVQVIRSHAEDKLIPGELNFDFGDKVIRINERLPNKDVLGVFLADRELQFGSPVVTARRGRILVDEDNRQVVFRLQDGEIYTEEEDPSVITTTRFDTLNYILQLQEQKNIDTIEVRLRSSYTTGELMARLRNSRPGSGEEARLSLELFTRLASPWACLGFAMAAVPLALVDPRSRKSGVVLRAVALVLGYFVLWIGCRDLILSGHAHPTILFIPAISVALLGVILTRRIDGMSGR